MLRFSRRHQYELISVFALLLLPFIAMQFSAQVNWSAGDFVVAGTLLIGLCAGIELVLHFVKKPLHRLVLGAVVLLSFLLVWAELAVGIFGTPLAGS